MGSTFSGGFSMTSLFFDELPPQQDGISPIKLNFMLFLRAALWSHLDIVDT